MSPTIANSDTSNTENSYALYDDPLYLSNHDQPAMRLVDYDFDGKYFLQWKRDIYFT